jgi:hypothetical protein
MIHGVYNDDKWGDKIISWYRRTDKRVIGLGLVILIAVVGLAICAGLFIYVVSTLVI